MGDNALMSRDRARAQLGMSKQYRAPEWKTCPMCGEIFIESSLPQPLIDRLGAEQIDFCTPCLRGVFCKAQGTQLWRGPTYWPIFVI